MSRRDKVSFKLQPLDNLRLAVQVSDERLADFLRALKKVRQVARNLRRPK